MQNNPFELPQADIYYSGVVIWREPTVMMCALSYNEGSLVQSLNNVSAELTGNIGTLAKAGLVSYEYWMWRYMKPFKQRPSSHRCLTSCSVM